MGCRIERNFLSAFLAMLNKALRSLLPGCKGGNVESKMNNVNGVESSCQQRVEITTLVVLVWVVTGRSRGGLAFFTPSRMSHIVVPSVPGIRSPMVNGNETPVDCNAAEAMFRKKSIW